MIYIWRVPTSINVHITVTVCAGDIATARDLGATAVDEQYPLSYQDILRKQAEEYILMRHPDMIGEGVTCVEYVSGEG